VRTAAHCRAAVHPPYCRTLPHIGAHCRTLAHNAALPHNAPHIAALPHTATLPHCCTAVPCRTLSRTMLQCRTLPLAMLHTTAAARIAAHCRTHHCHTILHYCRILPHCCTLLHAMPHHTWIQLYRLPDTSDGLYIRVYISSLLDVHVTILHYSN
jgi:hypothetical protein